MSSRTDKSVTTSALRQHVINALEELKAKDVREIDVRGRTSIADLLVIASGTSARHVKSIADEVVKFAKKAGVMPLGVEGEQEAEWVLVDLGDVIVHVMLPRIREFYGLERLWAVGGHEADTSAASAGGMPPTCFLPWKKAGRRCPEPEDRSDVSCAALFPFDRDASCLLQRLARSRTGPRRSLPAERDDPCGASRCGLC